jgi:murein L,D-transpeptidase YcbB/YkuD
VPTGYLDEATVDELNVPLESRVEQIQLALERYRWLHHYHAQEAVVVNIPAFHLYALDKQGEIALNMTVDVGEDFESTRTPVMSDHIEYVIFRPYWDVPVDIQRNEVVPLIAVTRDLSEFEFEAISPAGQVVADAKVTNALLEEIRTGAVHIRQKPGSMNPMGLVKFAFPNRYNVYLHDTPWRELRFMVPQRLVSHGCIHVERPAELAAWLLRDQSRWSLDAVSNAMVNGRDNLRVDLAKPLPILIFYTTASTLQHAHVHFYKDVYGYDEELRQTLATGHVSGK